MNPRPPVTSTHSPAPIAAPGQKWPPAGAAPEGPRRDGARGMAGHEGGGGGVGGWARAAGLWGGAAAAAAALWLAVAWGAAAGAEGSEEDREERARLRAAYADMAAGFRSGGVDAAAVSGCTRYFGGLAEGAGEWRAAWPREYASLSPPLPFPSVRLAVFPLADSPQLRNGAAAAAAAVARALPPETVCHLQPPNSLHVSVFFVSHPSDVCTDTVHRAPHEVAGSSDGLAPSAEAVALEREAVRDTLERAQRRPKMLVERVTFARSGTLLLLFVEEGGMVRNLRSDLREALPGAPAKQPNILHASLLRLLSPTTLPADAVERVDRVCDEWTQRLQGQAWEPEYLWFVLEREFATVSGEKTRYRLL